MLNKKYYTTLKRERTERTENNFKKLNGTLKKSINASVSINDELTKIKKNGWAKIDSSIIKVYKTKGFPQTMALVTAIGALCQQFDHHPDILTMKYSEVKVAFSTHSEGRITQKDIDIAKAIDDMKLFG